MPEKKSKYDTDPLDPDFVRRTEEFMGRATGDAAARGDETLNAPRRDPALEEQTRRFDEQISDAYPSVFIPPTYQPPRQRQPQPFTTFGAGPHQPPAQTAAPPPGPASAYTPGGQQQQQRATSRPVEKIGIPENIANVLPYLPFHIGLVASVIMLLIVPRHETRTRFHAAQGFALQLAVAAGALLFSIVAGITGSGFGGSLFGAASFIFLIVSVFRVWGGKPHHIAPLDDATKWFNDHITPKP